MKLPTHRCSVTGLSFHLVIFYTVMNLQLRAKSTTSVSGVHSALDLGESDVIKVHFVLNKKVLFRKMWKEVGIQQHWSGSGIPWGRTFKEVWNSGALFISGFRILQGFLTVLGVFKPLLHLTFRVRLWP